MTLNERIHKIIIVMNRYFVDEGWYVRIYESYYDDEFVCHYGIINLDFNTQKQIPLSEAFEKAKTFGFIVDFYGDIVGIDDEKLQKHLINASEIGLL